MGASERSDSTGQLAVEASGRRVERERIEPALDPLENADPPATFGSGRRIVIHDGVRPPRQLSERDRTDRNHVGEVVRSEPISGE